MPWPNRSEAFCGRPRLVDQVHRDAKVGDTEHNPPRSWRRAPGTRTELVHGDNPSGTWRYSGFGWSKRWPASQPARWLPCARRSPASLTGLTVPTESLRCAASPRRSEFIQTGFLLRQPSSDRASRHAPAIFQSLQRTTPTRTMRNNPAAPAAAAAGCGRCH